MSDSLPGAVFDGDDTLTRRRRVADSQKPAPFRVVTIEDDPAIRWLVEKVLRSAAIEVTQCATGAAGLEAIGAGEWDLCLLDRGLPDMNGLEICRRVKADPQFDARQVIILSSYGSLDERVEALDLGADDYITKPFHPAELLARVNASRRVIEMQQQLVEMAGQLEELSIRDSLTGVYNRRHFGTTVEKAFAHSQRYHRPLAVAIIDVDCFKTINDSLGHQAGDAVLAEVAKRFTRSIRASDYVARYGGEEFVVLLPEMQLEAAVTFGEKLRQAIATSPVAMAAGYEVPVTVSVGVASLAHSQFTSASELVSAADQALYRAKRNGRNCVAAERRVARRVSSARLPAPRCPEHLYDTSIRRPPA